MSDAITVELARFASHLQPKDLPAEVVRKLLLHTLDQLGAELAGATQPFNALVREYALAEAADGAAAVVGATRRVRPEWAALANGTAGHGLEIDDYHAEALSHPGCVAVPAVLAVGEELDAGGDEALVALALAFETIIRLGLAAQPSMIYDRGFHETCTEGVFGAALAAGKLRGLDAEMLISALGLACSHASGTTEYSQSGGEVKRLHAGLGAMGGLRAAALAARGFTGPRTIIEGRRGFLQAFAAEPRPAAVLDGLGERWTVLDAAIKPYFCCGLIHAPIDALTALAAEGVSANEIEEIVVGVDRLSLVHVGRIGPRPADMTGAQFSMHYSLGMTLAGGGNDFAAYRRAAAADFKQEGVLAVAERVRLELDGQADALFPLRFFARVRVRLRNGTVMEKTAFALGSPDAPMAEEQVRGKFRGIADEVIGPERARELEQAVDELASGGTVAAVGDALGGSLAA